MVVFLADRSRIQNKRLHRRITNRFQSDIRFEAVQFRITDPREPGPYRVSAKMDPRHLLEDNAYPVETARIEVGFEVQTSTEHEFYWWNWIDPDRNLLLGWHQDDTHPEYGPVHLQVNESTQAVDHQPAEFIDAHPMAVVEARLEQLPAAIEAVEWRDDAVIGLNW